MVVLEISLIKYFYFGALHVPKDTRYAPYSLVVWEHFINQIVLLGTLHVPKDTRYAPYSLVVWEHFINQIVLLGTLHVTKDTRYAPYSLVVLEILLIKSFFFCVSCKSPQIPFMLVTCWLYWNGSQIKSSSLYIFMSPKIHVLVMLVISELVGRDAYFSNYKCEHCVFPKDNYYPRC